MQIKEIYKQALLLCKNCRSPLSYLSFIQEEHPEGSVSLAKMTNVKAEEIISDSPTYLALSCPICSHTIGIKFVSLPFTNYQKNSYYISKF